MHINHFLSLILSLAVVSVQAEEIRGKVVSISDGDTITVLDSQKVQHKIRFQGIDAPETSQAFGSKCRQNLGDKIFGKLVVVTWTEKDRYDRILGEVTFGDRKINLEMVQDGAAWHYKQYSDSKELAEAEEKARKAKKGLWSEKSPKPPWEFRAESREKVEK